MTAVRSTTLRMPGLRPPTPMTLSVARERVTGYPSLVDRVRCADRDGACRADVVDRVLVDERGVRLAERAVEAGPPRGTMGGAAEAGDSGYGAGEAAAEGAGPGDAEAAGVEPGPIGPSPSTSPPAAATSTTVEASAANAQPRLGLCLWSVLAGQTRTVWAPGEFGAATTARVTVLAASPRSGASCGRCARSMTPPPIGFVPPTVRRRARRGNRPRRARCRVRPPAVPERGGQVEAAGNSGVEVRVGSWRGGSCGRFRNGR